MSEKYEVTFKDLDEYYREMVDTGDSRSRDKYDHEMALAFLERLEQLVTVLAQIRDRLPGQVAK